MERKGRKHRRAMRERERNRDLRKRGEEGYEKKRERKKMYTWS